MKKTYQNAFFLLGIAVLVFMASQLDFAETWKILQNAGGSFVAVIILWAFLYVINTLSWYIIIEPDSRLSLRNIRIHIRNNLHRSFDKDRQTLQNAGTVPIYDPATIKHKPQHPVRDAKSAIGFWWLYRITVSGFALNYATPGGLMGGEPYRIMELAPRIGTERASSSVILYVMTHIFSHFWFWLLSVILFLLTQPITTLSSTIMAAMTTFCILGLWFFVSGYRKGIAVRATNMLRYIPFVRLWGTTFIARNRERLDTIDNQISALHSQNRRTLITAVLLELACRVCSASEIYLIMSVVKPDVSYIQCILVLAFTTLFANLLFFMPLQIGGREGGFSMSAIGLGLGGQAGIFTALLVRVRELIWTGLGLLLIKTEKSLPRKR